MVNIHPSLLPAYKGLNAFERAFNAKDPESGITIHFVNDGVDEGKIIKQASFKRKPNDTIQDFTLRGQTLEHIIYPEFLSNLNTSFIMNTHPLTYEENNEI